MSDIISTLLIALVASVGSFGAFYFVSKRKGSPETAPQADRGLEPTAVVNADISREAVVVEAKAKANEIILEAKNEALKAKQEAQKEVDEIKREALETEKTFSSKKAELEVKEKQVNAEQSSLALGKEQLEKRKSELDTLISEQQSKLEKIAGLSKQDARNQLLESFERELQQEKGKKIREMEEEVKKDVDEKAKEIIVTAMRQGATDYVVEHSSSKVKLADDDMKGRIIGKEGRNIRKFEELTGVELELDATPGEILISSFDPIRREIAKISMERLIADGRIQPAKIEEIIAKTQSEVDKIIYKEGDNLCHRLGVYNLPEDVVKTLGKFKYRFSYGQNMIEHTLEVTKIGMSIASEIGADVEIVKLGCLFHDIGKVLEGEGTHVALGVDFLTKHKIRKEVIDCVAEHHEDKPFSSIESGVVHIADHISGARPSARSEDYEAYVKRLKDLEEAAYSFDGVEKVYALEAGREVRVFVKPERVDDASTALLAREIARKIELEQNYPGIVKVTVIRETRVTETAK
ncbi:ribonuclease Y [candidate division WWE3 bacterium RIFCSPHIGHO2_01_FULL_42_13]|uniref:Ribonuclease Y n=1 Tax=candidate division WWE3 bacterium RIFCSPHIGHO2_01_FULL_42_13 TaxID=1802617 RepID=A0A1F4UQM8_UNCKA|nr:MAG: ribonuclease Y [candidate division WWE3 bacterium RIFCSPHIGHO2_01_FULL_42_13]